MSYLNLIPDNVSDKAVKLLLVIQPTEIMFHQLLVNIFKLLVINIFDDCSQLFKRLLYLTFEIHFYCRFFILFFILFIFLFNFFLSFFGLKKSNSL